VISHVVAPSLQRMTAAGVFVFFAAMFVIPSGYSYGGAILLLVSVWMLAGRAWSWTTLAREDRILAWVLLSYGVVMIAMALLLGHDHRLIDKPVRALLSVPILLLLLRVPVRQAVMWAGIVVGTIASAALTGWEMAVEHADRAGAALNSIHFGNMTLVFSAFCAAGWIWAGTQQRHAAKWRAALALGMCCGLYSCVMSGSRGGWVAVPVVLSVFAAALLNRRNLAYAALCVAACVVVLGALFSRTDGMLHQRYVDVVSDIAQYRQNNADTSVGARFEMWRGAAINLPRHPILGWNMGDYEKALQDLVRAGRLHEIVLTYKTNLHNGYIHAWIFYGLPGLLVLLMLYGAPLWLFGRRVRDPDPGVRAIAVCGTGLVVSYACFNLTQAMFLHNNGIMFFLLALVILWSALRHARAAAHLAPAT